MCIRDSNWSTWSSQSTNKNIDLWHDPLTVTREGVAIKTEDDPYDSVYSLILIFRNAVAFLLVHVFVFVILFAMCMSLDKDRRRWCQDRPKGSVRVVQCPAPLVYLLQWKHHSNRPLNEYEKLGFWWEWTKMSRMGGWGRGFFNEMVKTYFMFSNGFIGWN